MSLFKDFIGMKDLKLWDGVTRTFSRLTSTGGTLTQNKIGSVVNVLDVYGSGSVYTDTTISTAISQIGTNLATLELTPGTWSIDNDITIPANLTLSMPHGSKLSIATGKTVTINGPFEAGLHSVFTGTGTVTFGNIESVYPEWWGAKRDGATADTAPIHSAIASLSSGGTVFFSPGLYKVNIAVTKNNIHLQGTGYFYNQVATTGLIADNAANPVVTLGDGVTSYDSISVLGLSILGQGTSDKGLLVKGVNRVTLDKFVIRNFRAYQVRMESTAATPTSYVSATNFSIAEANYAGSLGLDLDYGSSYTTAIYFSNGNVSASSLGSYTIKLTGSQMRLRLSDVWVTAGNNKGLYFANTNQHLYCSNVTVDSDSSADVLAEIPTDAVIQDYIHGTITIDGVVKLPSGNTALISGADMVATYSSLSYPMISNSLYFQNAAASAYTRYAKTSLPEIYVWNTQFSFIHTTGEFVFRTAANKGIILSDGTNNIRIYSGSGSPGGVIAAAVGSLWLRNDGGAGTSLYTKVSGSGTTGWKEIPTQAAAQADSTAPDVATLVSDFNSLLSKLRTAGALAP